MSRQSVQSKGSTDTLKNKSGELLGLDLKSLGADLHDDIVSFFSTTTTTPPQAMDQVQPCFYLFTKNNTNTPHVLLVNNPETIQRSYFNAKRTTKVIVHGFMDGVKVSEWMERMRNAYLDVHDCNVILVDWSKASQAPYEQATSNTWPVAKWTYSLIVALQQADKSCRMSQFHVIGHCLGAHVAGFVGKCSKGKLARITGLDPVARGFREAGPKHKLWRTDARFVDVIHTNGGAAVNGGWGVLEPCGHADFYPNGGEWQPGCHHTAVAAGADDNDNSTTANSPPLPAPYDHDHLRAIWLYIDALRPKRQEGKAFQAPTFKDFSLGNWEWNCDGRGKQCAYIGYRSVEWREKIKAEEKKFSRNQSACFYMATRVRESFYGHQYLLRFVLQPDKLSLFAPEMMIQFAHFTFDFEKEENGKSKHTFYHLFHQTFFLENGTLGTVFLPDEALPDIVKYRKFKMSFVLDVTNKMLAQSCLKAEIVQLPVHSQELSSNFKFNVKEIVPHKKDVAESGILLELESNDLNTPIAKSLASLKEAEEEKKACKSNDVLAATNPPPATDQDVDVDKDVDDN